MSRVITAAPCAHCPFRKDRPIYLRKARRAEIARSLLEGGEFPCHQTTVLAEDEEGEETLVRGANSKFCSGAAKAVLTAGGSNQMLRIMERLGMVDLDAVEEHPVEVWDLTTWQTLPEGATADERPEDDEEEVETCVNSDGGCLAPAGYLMGGSIVHGTESADGHCESCGDPLCSNCADEDGNCLMCTEVGE